MRTTRSNFSKGLSAFYVKDVRQALGLRFSETFVTWINSIWNTFSATSQFSETFVGWVSSIWNPLVGTLQFSETFVGWVSSIWNPLTPTLQFSDNFSSGW